MPFDIYSPNQLIFDLFMKNQNFQLTLNTFGLKYMDTTLLYN